MKIDFNDPDVFKSLERKAIDGQLNYSDYPPEEYKYFSRLSKIGYMSRHEGWSPEICNAKQMDSKHDYVAEKEVADCRMKASFERQENIRKAETLLSDIEKATKIEQIADLACRAIGCMSGDSSFYQRQALKFTMEAHQ